MKIVIASTPATGHLNPLLATSPRARISIRPVVPELKHIPQLPQWLRVAIERLPIDTIPAQHKGLQQVLRLPGRRHHGDDMIFGALPMLPGPRSKRPSIVLCGTSICTGAVKTSTTFAGLPPATTQVQLKEYAAISQDHDRVVNQPLARRLKSVLGDLGVGPLSMTLSIPP
jgi:hypothetical protein